MTDLAHSAKRPLQNAIRGVKKFSSFFPIYGFKRTIREISRNVIAAIIEPRMIEMLQLAHREMKKSDVAESLSAGVVLTGGASLLVGLSELAERVMGMPVKIGYPNVSGGLVETVRSPAYATGVGLIYYAYKHGKKKDNDDDHTSFKWVFKRLKDIFQNMFGE